MCPPMLAEAVCSRSPATNRVIAKTFAGEGEHDFGGRRTDVPEIDFRDPEITL
jgi:hypothetical protein